MSKRKKVLILSIMVLVLAVAVVLNFTLLGEEQTDDASTATASFFTTYRETRQSERNQEILYLDSVIAMEGEEFVDARQTAVNQKLKLVEIMEKELLLESLLKAKGYEDVIVSVGLTNDNINVVVKADEITREDTAKIYSTIKNETNTSSDMVKILSTK
ncbi:MAG: SpoIIIAH-like family protein [Clostridiales bacterium]|nr:SpoIIIAH-like family protein [Clostridiales bacterium]